MKVIDAISVIEINIFEVYLSCSQRVWHADLKKDYIELHIVFKPQFCASVKLYSCQIRRTKSGEITWQSIMGLNVLSSYVRK